MDGNADPEKESLTDSDGSSNGVVISRGGGSEDGDEGQVMMSRRAMLFATGVATASMTGIASGRTVDETVQVQNIEVYGYGGNRVLAETAETEPNGRRGTAQEVSLGTKITAKLERAGVDWFAFEAESGQRVVAEFDRSSTDGVTGVIVYGPGGDYKNLVFVGTDEGVNVVETVDTTGPHYVEVVDIQEGDGDYTLTLTTGSGTKTTTEDQPTVASAEDDYGEQTYGEQTFGGIDA